MLNYIVRRVLYMLIVIFILTIVSFVVIQLPPGDLLSSRIDAIRQSGIEVNEEYLASLQRQYGVDRPLYQQYFLWLGKIIFHFDFGRSMQYDEPVVKLIGERMVLTIVISFVTLIVHYLIAIPIGIYSATHQYSPGDYFWTFIGFIGLATPDFLLALILMFFFYFQFGMDIGGLFSLEFQVTGGWSLAKVWDMIKHLPIPILVIATSGTAGLIRVLRGTLLDELSKAYVVTARAKGVSEMRLLFRYPVRLAINPLVSTIGNLLPAIVSGSAITSIVLNLPTTGPILLNAVRSQDMYLAAGGLLMLSTLGVIGMLISDLLLAVVDPRIRFEKRSK